MGQGGSGRRAKIRPDESELAARLGVKERDLLEWRTEFDRLCVGGRLERQDFRRAYSAVFRCDGCEAFADRVFCAFDTDGSGHIDFCEFMTALSVAGSDNVEEKLRWAFRIYDSDCKGWVSRQEMLDIFSIVHRMAAAVESVPLDKCKMSAAQRVSLIFSEFDTDKDGRLTLNEFVNGAMRDPEVVRIFRVTPSLAATPCRRDK